MCAYTLVSWAPTALKAESRFRVLEKRLGGERLSVNVSFISTEDRKARRMGRVHNYGVTIVTDKAAYNTNGSVIRQAGKHLNGQT